MAEPFVVLLLIVDTAVDAWVHLRSSSIWYDEAVTLLSTSGHAKLEWSRGLSQFTPSANHRDVHPPLYFWTLGFLLLAMATNKSLTKMPTEYYLGVGTPFLALLIGFGAGAFPEPFFRSPPYAARPHGRLLRLFRVSCPRGRSSTRYRAG